MPRAAKSKKQKPPPEPNELVRESAGVYRSGDGRFEVQKSDLGWFLVDTEQANEFGQQLIHGPISTLDAVRAAMPGTRDLKPLLRIKPRRGKPAPSGSPTRAAAKREAPPARPPSWIDQLPADEARNVRRLIGALEREGVADAEDLVKRHRDGSSATIATRVVEQRLARVLADLPADGREEALALLARTIQVLAQDGTVSPAPLPRWALVELNPDETPPARQIKPKV